MDVKWTYNPYNLLRRPKRTALLVPSDPASTASARSPPVRPAPNACWPETAATGWSRTATTTPATPALGEDERAASRPPRVGQPRHRQQHRPSPSSGTAASASCPKPSTTSRCAAGTPSTPSSLPTSRSARSQPPFPERCGAHGGRHLAARESSPNHQRKPNPHAARRPVALPLREPAPLSAMPPHEARATLLA